MKTILLTCSLLFGSLLLVAQPLAIPKKKHHHQHNHQHNHQHDHGHDHGAVHTSKKTGISFIKNLNQWHKNVKYKASLGGFNTVFLEQNTFTYLFAHADDAGKIHEVAHRELDHVDVRMHAYKVHFKNAQTVDFKETGKHQEYNNYFLGNDQEKWASKVPLFNKITYQSLYEGIDLEAYNNQGHFKYDLIVQANVDPSIIQLEYEGADAIEIDNSALVIHTSVETIVEQKPYTYQVINGKEIVIPCEYELKGNTVSFVFPEGYDKNHPLIIDPTVIAATLSGVNGEYNFGHSATFDNQGNIYAGGRSFGAGYLTTTGAFQTQYGGGASDIAVTKYNPTGNAQIYATYIGGTLEDVPHSMVADFNGQLYILGTSNSSNYPTTNNAFQSIKGNLMDIVVTKLNTDGSSLVGSTFMGGSASDGVNQSTLNSNYDDHFRGEIVLDNQGNAYIASCTSSGNFPVTANAFDTSHNPSGNSSQDGVVFKLNNDLSTLFWSTYLGESGDDTAFGLRVNDFGNVYVTGIAGGFDFPTTPGTVQSVWGGGQEDGYVTVLNPTGSALVASTFWGTDGDEHSFFLDIDEADNVHIYGQTTGEMDITPNTYFFNEDSKQFLASFSSDLNSIVYSTVIGNGPNGGYDYVPVAFMVDKCNNIYFSGYYAVPGLPTTNDAISTNGGSVYLGVLNPLAESLQFGTYYGEADHVDGGTSRFDKSGTVYQGVCSCTSSGVLNTLPGAFAETQSTFCDIGVFKIDFEVPTVTAAAVASPSTSGCAPFEVDFQYTGQDATVFEWIIDDGNGFMTTTQNTNYTFEDPGTYTVTLIASNSLTCNSTDTTFLIIDVLAASSTLTDTTICNPNETIFLDASTINAAYIWHDGSTGSTYSANGAGTYWVDISLLNGACTRRDSFVLELNNTLNVDLGPNFSVCDEIDYTLDATTSGGLIYEWDNGSDNPTLNISDPGTYAVSIYDSDGCLTTDQITVAFSETPEVDLGPDTTLCDLYTLMLDIDIANVEYRWQDGSTNNNFTVTDPGEYWVEVDNDGCIASDTVFVNYLAEVFLDIESYDVQCNEDCDANIDVTISGGNGQLNFLWDTGVTDADLNDLCAGSYNLTITDDLCNYVLSSINILEPEPLEYEFIVTDVPCPGDGTGSIELSSVTGGTAPYLFSYNDSPFTSDTINRNLNGGDYEFVVIDANGCTAGEVINVYEPPAVVISAGEDKRIELGESVELDGFVFPNDNQNVSWSPIDSLSCIFCLEPMANPSSTTTYTITTVDSLTGCILTDEMVVEVIKNRNVFIPNVFTPNGDGTNDEFSIYTGNGVRRILDFKIYNRWGALVYAAENIYPNHGNFGWDGSLKGKDLNNAVFAWYAEIEFLDDEVILYKGDVTLAK